MPNFATNYDASVVGFNQTVANIFVDHLAIALQSQEIIVDTQGKRKISDFILEIASHYRLSLEHALSYQRGLGPKDQFSHRTPLAKFLFSFVASNFPPNTLSRQNAERVGLSGVLAQLREEDGIVSEHKGTLGEAKRTSPTEEKGRRPSEVRREELVVNFIKPVDDEKNPGYYRLTAENVESNEKELIRCQAILNRYKDELKFQERNGRRVSYGEIAQKCYPLAEAILTYQNKLNKTSSEAKEALARHKIHVAPVCTAVQSNLVALVQASNEEVKRVVPAFSDQDVNRYVQKEFKNASSEQAKNYKALVKGTLFSPTTPAVTGPSTSVSEALDAHLARILQNEEIINYYQSQNPISPRGRP